ncbi:uncharacterized protein GIQ15_02449 [Arthroderma uncinatum]|uniref:uncharacterized protein n=1 Tax=Arthroderma uncinatum TaxID=74035 RepID=UPI00144A5F71|nr:uncharacterized protein GIQ15_02449 [Arthroderma uncinatum]KAF3483125.1 hypothetical protein GIQ15_02449 [Arthroderma uncinatum]
MGSPDEGFQRRRSAPGFGNKSHRGNRGGYGYRSKKTGQGHASFHPLNAPFPQDQPPPSCFNCGSFDHMVHHCPEYQHEASPGFHKHPRPPKRQRTTDGSRHQFRDEFPPAQRGHPHRSFSHPSHPYQPGYHQPGYDHPGPGSPEQEEWHHRPPYGYPPYDPHGPPPPMNGYDGYDAHGPMPPYPYNAPPPGYHPRRPNRRREGDYPEYPMEGPPPPSSWDGPPRNQAWRGKGRKGRDGPPSSRRPDHWVEGFYDLDTPENRAANGQVVWRPPHPVGRPLPAIFSDLDDICKLPPFASLPPGMSVSKYFLNKGPEEFNENIRNTEDWPFMMDDPIFSELPSDGESVPIKDLISQRKEIMAAHKIVPRKPVVEEEAAYDSEQADENEMPQEEGSYAGSEQGQEDYNQDYNQGYGHDYQEDSPARTPSQSYPVSPKHYDSPMSDDGNQSERGDNTRPQSRESYRDGVSQRGSREPSPNPEHENPHSPINDHDQNQFAAYKPGRPNNFPHQRDNGKYQNHYQRNNKPKRGRPNGYKRQFSQTWNTEEYTSTPQSATPGNNDSDEHLQTTPDKYTQAQSPSESYHRKRSREESSELPDDEPQRQIDDVAPRLKRRHPRVAEAYSRRW